MTTPDPSRWKAAETIPRGPNGSWLRDQRLIGARLECPRALDSPNALKDMSAMSLQRDYNVSRVSQRLYDSTNSQRASDQDLD